MTSEYVVIRLGSGEQVMALKTAESDTTVTLLYPMQIKSYPREREDGSITETVAGAPFCHFADEKIFTINKNFIVFENALHPKLVPFYTDMVDQYEASENDHPGAEEEEESPIEKLFSMLEQVKGAERLEDNEHDILIEGNDTIH